MKQNKPDHLLPLGFKAAGIAAGIKKNREKDLALLYSLVPAKTAALFTSNCLKSAHILIDQEKLTKRFSQAIIVNSGNANCATGKEGIAAAGRVIQKIASLLDIRKELVLAASTGVIGRKFPDKTIILAAEALVKGLGYSYYPFSEAIMTTDTFPKRISRQMVISGKRVNICGIAKGAGMIYPRLATSRGNATMLCFLMSDANVSSAALKQALAEAVDNSFNCISVDADTSPNDSVFLMANGLAGNTEIALGSRNLERFKQELVSVCQELSRMIVQDGEGATKFVKIWVKGSSTKKQAAAVAAAVSSSLLVKTMFFGEDPNWGRILSAAGASRVKFNPDNCAIFINKYLVFSKGRGRGDISRLKRLMKPKDITVILDLKSGKESAFVWTTDLSYKYVEVNSGYTT